MIEIAHRSWRCLIAPEQGGAIARLLKDGIDILRPVKAEQGPDGVLGMASFPLVPFANRIGQGVLRLGDDVQRLSPDAAALPHAHHGHGWRAEWQVEQAAADHAVLTLAHDGGQGWPWRYEARQSLRLDDDGLCVAIEIRNGDGHGPMPSGAGIHPYFRRTPDSAIAITSDRVWCNDEGGLASHAASDGRFRSGKMVSVDSLEGCDNFFVASGEACIATREGAIHLSGSPIAGFHIYVPAGKAFFCVEPVSHAPNAFGRGEFGPDDLLLSGEKRIWTYRISL